MIKNITLLLTTFNGTQKKMALLAIALAIINSGFDLVGISLIYFYISSVINPEQFFKIEFVQQARGWLGHPSEREFFVALGAVLFLFYLVRSIVSILSQLSLPKLSYNWFCSVSDLLLRSYLSLEYGYYLRHHTSEAKHALVESTLRLAHSFLLPITVLISEAFSVIMILLLLFIMKPQLSPILLAVCCVTFALYLLSSRKFIRKIGHERIDAGRSRHKIINELFNVIKEIKIFPGASQFFVEHFKSANLAYSRTAIYNHVIGIVPRTSLEFLSIVAILTITIYELLTATDVTDSLALIALYGVAATRLLPSCIKVVYSINVINTEAPSFNNVIRVIEACQKTAHEAQEKIKSGTKDPFFKKEILLSNISYNYHGISKSAVTGISLSIPKNTFVGIFGRSGAGKSTLLDIIMGLIVPQKGTLRVDGKKITKSVGKKLKKSIGYVPQKFTLIDASIAENIAFGRKLDEIDLSRVQKVCQMADISEFIDDLPGGYKTRIGERGNRFSGGQAQRLAIARALYNEPEILVLDEPTASLDMQSEKQILETLRGLRDRVTIVLVTHQTSVLSVCDIIYLFEDGKIIGSGPYSKIKKRFKSR